MSDVYCNQGILKVLNFSTEAKSLGKYRDMHQKNWHDRQKPEQIECQRGKGNQRKIDQWKYLIKMSWNLDLTSHRLISIARISKLVFRQLDLISYFSCLAAITTIEFHFRACCRLVNKDNNLKYRTSFGIMSTRLKTVIPAPPIFY